MSSADDLPRPAPGTRITVEPGQWQLCPGRPGTSREIIDLVAVHPAADPAWAWVHAHDISCCLVVVECPSPCVEILVPVAVLAAARG
ncbi:hypothetical protein [Micromonospora endophytica]|uniref:Uncharacterized protein n=1 Tax=Micromonospora endophytica TaxID=515350 RepID=A0A2W2BBR6_9ACTN|nr:hypothetical protein [Micromonospora endophytica]PZF85061.1 hypothetical protein C1I93_28920 [Micromonospora endophytica]RIW51340.1 hypothetical protein D3H59_00210 [Micromonospora endophytica]BCJ62018.1 hypothetical protein Jiend_54400 [Micromonospora endophytica]